MYSRKTVSHNINNLTPKIWTICYKVTADKVAAESLLTECLSVLSLKTQGSALGNLSLYKSQLFKQALSCLSGLLVRREVPMNSHDSAFYQLTLFHRFLLILKYRLSFQNHELSQITGLSEVELDDEIFKAKNQLNENSSLEVEASL